MANKKIISLEDETRAKLDQIAQDFNFLRRRIDSWKELRETDLMVYEHINEFVSPSKKTNGSTPLSSECLAAACHPIFNPS